MNLFYATLTEQIKTLPIYLTSAGLFYDESYVKRDMGYGDYQWLQTVSGQGKIILDNQETVLDQNTGLFIPPHIPHQYEKTSKQWITQWVSFNGKQLAPFFHQLDMTRIQMLPLKENRKTLQLIEDIYYLACDNYNNNAFKISSILYSTIEEMYTQASGNHAVQSIKNMTISKVIDYIDLYYMMDLTIDEVAGIAQVTPQYLCRLFKDKLQMRPFEYIKRVRINKSKSLLLNSPLAKIEDIGEAVGIHSASYFTSIFKSIESMTPSDFIKLHQGRGL